MSTAGSIKDTEADVTRPGGGTQHHATEFVKGRDLSGLETFLKTHNTITMVDTSYTNNRLQIGDEEIEFEHRIADVLVAEETIVVLLQVRRDSQEEVDRNIIAFDRDGTQRWRIEAPSEGYDGMSYITIQYEDNQLSARNLNSYEYDIDIHTGEVTQTERYDK
ncbi:hypothetical protein [Natrinema hispanicum]|mgnify:CR=1 FL=1|uniref:Uncharacterized protein n=1 Tax=Natrinema hispanicum TaxID=392421 RepID=A0A1I0JY86_9EURY|nr:hypothetical protein [Natrinema hispanicum]SEU15979.1 hypothetical protein SAMN04488694_1921 [Natrinema hispanicum]